ncbi:hypothetical protein AC244_13560 [Ensifer adhaerens]|uniref:DUF1236 domain-containing protein n=1 Tax=Ensifer adhaerens TaxID=106592 RepID=A0A0L8BUZ1_ENSAD|nr:DUF1236 domain-containing protein [Ensifer adhaerens]KOF18403.1 hypothetical protein AC244_13560 [Ensifer adhaerens]
MRNTALAALAISLPIAVSALAQTTSTTVVLPGEVRTYVLEQKNPSVAYEREIVIGEPLPETVKIYPVPDQPKYGYAIVNERRVIIDPNTHTVIEVLE